MIMDKHSFGNEEIRYIVRKNPDSKYVQLKLRPNLELEVTIPSERPVDVKRILWKKRDWIERKYQEMAAKRKIFDGRQVLYKGAQYKIAFKRRVKRAQVSSKSIMLPLHDAEEPQAALKRWMGNETKKFVQRKVGNYRSRIRLSSGDFSVGDITKWAYCTRSRHIVFNWRLISLPRELADYVVLHEICHLKEFNHSLSFRYALASLCPDFKEKEAMLRRYVIN
jgi:predicted metal-dependent hydrolase